METGIPGTTNLRLEGISGPDHLVFDVASGEVRIGRIIDCEIRLSHQSISRRHAELACRDGVWHLTDLGSRHGTFVNESRLDPQATVILAHNDLLRIGPWTFRVGIGETHGTAIRTIDDSALTNQDVVEPVSGTSLGSLARHRLSLLIDCAARIHSVSDEGELASVVLQSAMAGTGFNRSALLRSIKDDLEVEVLASRTVKGDSGVDFAFSRSLIRTAASGQIARLESPASRDVSQSIAELRIQSALCAPIQVGDTVVAFLYLDTRDHERSIHSDAAEFCQALARMSSLAIANLRRVDLERRQRLLESQLDAASEAQRMIVPADAGLVNGVRYALRMQPGLYVAGDLFDIFSVGHNRVAVMIGDVTGEGIGAAILMATTQAHLHASLRLMGDPAMAIAAVNRYVVEHSEANRFVSMWVGIVDTETGRMTYVDAGHGHWMMLHDGSPVEVDRSIRGIPLGIDSFTYCNAVVQLGKSTRIVLYSDGVIEQRAHDGDPFGMERLQISVTGSASAEEDVDRLFSAVNHHTGSGSLDDDTTVASIELLDAPLEIVGDE